MKYASIFVLVGFLTACATDPNAAAARPPQHDDPSKGIYCNEVVETGSAFLKKKCTTPEQREAERREYEKLENERRSLGTVTNSR